jgi:hypothetical protein
MRRWVPALLVAVLLVQAHGPTSALAVGTSAAGTMATWQTALGGHGTNGTATAGTRAAGTGWLRLRATNLVAGGSYAIGIYRGTCRTVGTRIIVLPAQRADTSGRITRTLGLDPTQAPWLLASSPLALRIGVGTRQRCGDLRLALTGGPIPLGTAVRIPATTNGALGRHDHEVIDMIVVDPDPAWAPDAEEGDVGVAVRVRIRAIDATHHDPQRYAVRTAGGIDLPPRPGVTPVLPVGTAAAGGVVDGWVTFLVPEDEVDGLMLAYSPASGLVVLHELK